MPIEIPEISLKIVRNPPFPSRMIKDMEIVDCPASEVFQELKTSLVIGVPGAFTPVCSTKHVPAFFAMQDQFRQEGIDKMICISVNDPFVMKAWAASLGVANPIDKIAFVADYDAALTRILGLEIDLCSAGLGIRSQRYVAFFRGRCCDQIFKETSPGECLISSAERMLEIARSRKPDLR